MKREPFLKMAKREKISWQKRLLIRFIALLLSLIVCAGVIFLLVRMNPMDVYKAIWDGALGSERRVWITLRDTMVLLCIAIGLAPAFKMRFWNIGAEGQILVGGACAAAVMIYAGDSMSPVLLLNVCMQRAWRNDLGNDSRSVQSILEYKRNTVYSDAELCCYADRYVLHCVLGESQGLQYGGNY